MSVTISGNTYDTYGDAAGLGVYANGSLAHAGTHTAASADNRARALVEATRILVLMPFTDETHADPTTAGLPQAIIDAAYELALAGLADTDIFTSTTTEDKLKRFAAKGLEFEWFGPREGGRLPGRVAELLAPYLGGVSSSGVGAGSYAAGVDGESAFDECDEYSVNGGG